MDQTPHWQFIYIISQGFPSHPNYQEVQNYREFFESLQYVIPSSTYRQHYREYMKKNPIGRYLDNQESINTWVLGIHPTLIPKMDSSTNLKKIWQYLYMICSHYPQQPTFQEVLYYKHFFLCLQNVLPFEFQKQYNDKFKQISIDPYLSSNNLLLKWINQMYQQIDESNTEYLVEGFSDGRMTSLIVSIVLIGAVICIKNCKW